MAAPHQVVVDEGGVRHVHDGVHRYFAYADLVDIELRTRLLRDPILVFIDRDEKEHVVFAGPDALEIHKALTAFALSAAALPRMPEHWRRDGRPLDEWLHNVGESATSAYRVSGDTTKVALGVLRDLTSAVEDRAAAAYLLVRFAEGDDLVETAKVFASRKLPPLVVAAAQLAEGGVAIVNDEAHLFLSSEDRDRWYLHRQTSTTERHAAAHDEALRQLREADQQALRTAHGPRPTTTHPAAAYRDMSKWIGKSWGI